MTISIDEKDQEVKKVPQQLLPDKIIDIDQDQEAVIK